MICVLLMTGTLIHNGFIPIPMGTVRVLVAAITLILIAQQPQRVWQTLRHDPLLMLLLLLASLSFSWSLEPFLSFRRGIALFLASLLGVYIAATYNLGQQVRLYLFMIHLILIGSVLSALFLPEYGVMTGKHAGSWNGVLSHKNVLGRVASLDAVLLLYFPAHILGVKWRFLWAVLAIVTVIFTGSASAQMIVIVLLLAYPLYRILRTHPFLLVGLGILGAILVSGGVTWLLLYHESVFMWFGRDATLTGRTQLWQTALTLIAERPLFGHGYTASFAFDSPIFRLLIWKDAPHAHNGWLDITLDLGLIGVILFTLHNIRALGQSAIQFRKTQDTIYGVVLVFVIVFLAGSITDTSPLILRDIMWIMYVSLTMRVQSKVD